MRWRLLLPVPIIYFAATLYSAKPCADWGFFGHRLINRTAVFCLPQEMLPFYKSNIDFLTEAAVNPDKRRYAVHGEAVRHYIDLDVHGEYPFDDLPRKFGAALIDKLSLIGITPDKDTVPLSINDEWKIPSVQYALVSAVMSNENTVPVDSFIGYAFGLGGDSLIQICIADTFTKHGTLPYHLPYVQRRLTRAMASGNKKLILSLSADIGHYIADAHVPLHTSSNYDGQLTGQKGLHAFWESRIPELMADGYDFWVGRPAYIEDPESYYWDIVFSSHHLVDSVVSQARAVERELRNDRQFSFESRGNQLVRIESPEYVRKYSNALGGMVERRMRMAIHAVASAWYTAWVDAGHPDLENGTIVISRDTIQSSRVEGVRAHD